MTKVPDFLSNAENEFPNTVRIKFCHGTVRIAAAVLHGASVQQHRLTSKSRQVRTDIHASPASGTQALFQDPPIKFIQTLDIFHFLHHTYQKNTLDQAILGTISIEG
jgi:hypothetical protein